MVSQRSKIKVGGGRCKNVCFTVMGFFRGALQKRDSAEKSPQVHLLGSCCKTLNTCWVLVAKHTKYVYLYVENI